MKVGFTGTRNGMTDQQKQALRNLLRQLRPIEVHHGDCIGADYEFHGIAYGNCNGHVKRVIHPPTDDLYRAFCGGDETRPEKPYLERDHAIVDETDALIVMSMTTGEIMRSGTWATVRYARRAGKPVYVVQPRGRIETFNVCNLCGHPCKPFERNLHSECASSENARASI